MSSRSGLALLLLGIWLAVAGGATVRTFMGLPAEPAARTAAGHERNRLLYLGVLLVVIGAILALRGVFAL